MPKQAARQGERLAFFESVEIIKLRWRRPDKSDRSRCASLLDPKKGSESFGAGGEFHRDESPVAKLLPLNRCSSAFFPASVGASSKNP
jgi:hypothetical protein